MASVIVASERLREQVLRTASRRDPTVSPATTVMREESRQLFVAPEIEQLSPVGCPFLSAVSVQLVPAPCLRDVHTEV